MAESSTFGKSINLGSDQIPETYCEPCHDISDDIKPVAGYCLNCDERLCKECYDSHLRRKQFRSHQLQVDKPTMPKSKTLSEKKHKDSAQKCSRHHGETLQSFCKTHFQVCCKVCLTINHPRCDTEDISNIARDIQTSGQLEDLNQKLIILKTGFNDNLSQAETNRSTIQSNYTQAKDEMKKLSEDFDRLMTETENQADKVKEEDFRQSQSISKRCNVILDQINKITANLEQLKNKGDNDNIFISMKRAEHELQSLKENLSQLDTENIVRAYKFEPDMKLQDLMSQLKVLGNLYFLQATHTSTTSPAVSISTTSPAVSISTTSPAVSISTTSPAVSISTTSPAVSISTTSPAVSISTTSPAVSISTTSPAVSISTTSPAVSISTTSPAVSISTTSPAVSISTTSPAVSISTTSPAVSISTTSPAVSISTTSPAVSISTTSPAVSISTTSPAVSISTTSPAVSISTTSPAVSISTTSPAVSISTTSPAVSISTTSPAVSISTTSPAVSISTTSPAVSISTTSPAVSISQQMAKTPTHVKDVKVSDKTLYWHGSVVLPNQQIVITDNQNNKVKLIDTNKGIELSQIQLSGNPVNITKVKTNEFAVLLNKPNNIHILNLSQNIFSRGRELPVSSGSCYGLAYNTIDQLFVVAFYSPAKVELINMTGTVLRTIQTDSKGSALFGNLYCAAFNPDSSGIYVTDQSKNTVVLLSLNGDVKAVYKDKGLEQPNGICVHKSGVVYVVGYRSHTVHQLDPDSGEFKLLLEKKDDLFEPYSISYCDVEDKMYVGFYRSSTLRVFEMKL